MPEKPSNKIYTLTKPFNKSVSVWFRGKKGNNLVLLNVDLWLKQSFSACLSQITQCHRFSILHTHYSEYFFDDLRWQAIWLSQVARRFVFAVFVQIKSNNVYIYIYIYSICLQIKMKKKVREKSRECHNHKSQPSNTPRGRGNWQNQRSANRTNVRMHCLSLSTSLFYTFNAGDIKF